MTPLVSRIWGRGGTHIVFRLTPPQLAEVESVVFPEKTSPRWVGASGALAILREPELGNYRGLVALHMAWQAIRGGAILLVESGGRPLYRQGIRRHPGAVRWGTTGEPLLRLGADEAFIEYCETAPRWRGRGVYPAALQYTAHRLFDEGIRTIWIETEEANRPAVAGIRRSGFEEIRRVKPWKWLTRRIAGGSRGDG